MNCFINNEVISFCTDLTIRRTSGIVDISILSQYPHLYNITFHIDQLIRLNITFYKLFSLGGSKSCNFEWIKLLTSNNIMNETQLFIYCEHYPPFNFYPKFNKLGIEIFTQLDLEFTLNFSSTLIDRTLISNIVSVNFSNDDINSHFPSYKVKAIYIQSFVIQLDKAYHVKIKQEISVLQIYVILYDGPGFLVPSLDITHIRHTLCSTFQCILQVVLQYNLVSSLINLFTYSSKLVSINRYVSVDHNKSFFIHPPNQLLASGMYSTFIASSSNFQINGTVEQITYKGIYNPSCHFGGLVITESLEGYYKGKFYNA